MKATYMFGPGEVRIVDSPDPTLKNLTDAIVRIIRASTGAPQPFGLAIAERDEDHSRIIRALEADRRIGDGQGREGKTHPVDSNHNPNDQGSSGFLTHPQQECRAGGVAAARSAVDPSCLSRQHGQRLQPPDPPFVRVRLASLVVDTGWPQGNFATGCCTIDSGQAAANPRM